MQSDKFVIIVSGPSGVGKSTICNAFLETYKNFSHPVSATTRPPRDYEINGQHYNFVTMEQYEEMLENNELLEAVTIYGNKYGTQKKVIEAQLIQHNLIFVIDNHGMRKIKEFFTGKANVITIFILPPSLETLFERIEFRGDQDGKIQERTDKALNQIQAAKEYDYVIMNDNLEKAIAQFFATYEITVLNLERQLLLELFFNI